MELNGQKSSGDHFDTNGAFRRLSSDASNRKYRRRSPVGRKGSPVRSRTSSLSPTRKNSEKNGDIDRRRTDDERDSGTRDKRHSNNQSSRSSHRRTAYDDDYARHGTSHNDENRDSTKSSHSFRNSRDKHYLDHSSRNVDHRSRDYPHHVDKHYRDKYDGNRDMGRETSYHENVKQRSKDSVSDRVGSSMAHSAKEGDMYNEYRESKSEKTDHRRDEKFSSSKDEVFVAKRSKFDIIDVETKSGIDVAKPAICADEKHYSSPKQGEVSSDQGVKDSDIDAAKVAAMKAAELVNKNLIGTGCLTADQKKKLLWGNKKSSYKSEESAHCWDTSTFGDLERQEKFNKLMGVKGNTSVEHKPPGGVVPEAAVEKQREQQLQIDLERQYTAGLRRRDGRTVGLGL
ncbi:unnamed protein product [Cuscuta europaea]|uniref:Small acidic protein-like domain-containing protein n=1 Tax=Cuscuta europaea TaxID=41803 RepID=A0A9P0YJY0_CUSEU|nr:unnamed protein product [Cuscuta europaea]